MMDLFIFLFLLFIFGSNKDALLEQFNLPGYSEESPLPAENPLPAATPEKDHADVTGELVVTFVDVGQGDCTFIQQGDEAVMIDTGYWMQKEACESILYENQCSEFKLILTHPDADHIGNADALTNDFFVQQVLMPDKASDTTVYEIDMRAFRETSTPYEYVQAGDSMMIGDAKLSFFGPVTIPEDPEDTNNASLMMKLEFGDTAFIFIGDAEPEEEEEAFSWALSNGFDLSCDVFKCGHHGSWNSLYEPLYEAADADYYIISCGSDNEYGHPSESVLDYIDHMGGICYLTETRGDIEGKGNITVTSDGTSLTWAFEK